jgi:hypothetical protein
MGSKLQALMEEKTVMVGKALRNLDSALARFDELLATDYCWVSVDSESTSSAAMVRVRAVYTEMDDDCIGDRRAMPGCRGIVAVTPRVIEAADRVNAAKVELKNVFAGLKGTKYVKRLDQDGRLSRVPVGILRLTVAALGRPNLNVFAAYRKIPILTGRPRRVGFGITHAYTVYPTAREIIADRLRRRCNADSLEDLERVQRLPRHESTLAQLTGSRQFPFVGVHFDGFDRRGRCYEYLLTGVPILYLATGVTPTVRYVGQTSRPRRKSSDRKVCPEQYLKTMRVHRYLRYMGEAELRGG